MSTPKMLFASVALITIGLSSAAHANSTQAAIGVGVAIVEGAEKVQRVTEPLINAGIDLHADMRDARLMRDAENAARERYDWDRFRRENGIQ